VRTGQNVLKYSLCPHIRNLSKTQTGSHKESCLLHTNIAVHTKNKEFCFCQSISQVIIKLEEKTHGNLLRCCLSNRSAQDLVSLYCNIHIHVIVYSQTNHFE